MKSRRLALIALAACLSTTALAHAQGKPAPRSEEPAPPRDLIAKGQALFDDQQYEESIQALSGALLRPSNTKAQRVEIYRLLALNYITLGRTEESEGAVRGLLVIDPEYQLPETESPRFRDFFTETRAKWEEEGRPGLVAPEAPPLPTTLRHGSPSQVEPSKSVPLVGRLEDPGGLVAGVRLYYRTGTRGDFTRAAAQIAYGASESSPASVRATIPASAVAPPLVEYYLVAVDVDGNALASRGDASSPLRIAVPEPSKGWVLPVAIGGGVLGAAAIVGVLALAGVFSGSSNGGGGTSVVSVSVSESSRR
jgi:tetratricopeptide (TPR) repeat protein